MEDNRGPDGSELALITEMVSSAKQIPDVSVWPYCQSCRGHMTACHPEHPRSSWEQCVWQCMNPKCAYRRARSGWLNGQWSYARASQRIEAESRAHCKTGDFCSAHMSTDEGMLLEQIEGLKALLETRARCINEGMGGVTMSAGKVGTFEPWGPCNACEGCVIKAKLDSLKGP